MTKPVCNRCQRPAKRKGRMSAAIYVGRGRYERRYLCSPCCAALKFDAGGGHR